MAPFVCSVGFSLFLLTDILCFHADTALAPFVALAGETYVVISTTARLVGFCVLALLCASHVNSSAIVRKMPLFAAVLFTGGIVVIAVNPAEAIVDACALAVIATTQATLSLAWLSHISALSYKNAYLFLLSAHALATLLCAFLLKIAGPYLAATAVAAFLLSCWCARRFGPKADARDYAFSFEQARCTLPVLGRGVCAVGLFAFVSGFMGAIDPPADDVSIQWATLAISATVIAIMSVPALLLKQPLKLENSYRLALPLSALGFLVLPGLAADAIAGIAGVLSTTGYMVCGIVLYCTIAEVCRAANMPSSVLYAASETIMLTLLLAGRLCGGIAAMVMPRDAAGFVVVAFGCLYLCILGMSWLLGRGSAQRRNEPASGMRQANDMPQPRLRDDLASMAAFYGLDERERDIFTRLIEGRSIPRIAQDLYLSPSAIKYHVQKIYRKLDIHTRGELAALARHPFFPEAMRCESSVSPTAGHEGHASAPQDEAPSPAAPTHRVPQVTPATAAHDCGRALEQFTLTEREREVFALLAQARTVEDIAQHLGISDNTVKTHIKRIYKKMGIHSRQDVIDFALNHAMRV